MRKLKVSLCTMLTAILMLGMQVSAASGINTHEQRVLDALGQSRTTSAGASLKIPAQYINQATTYLRRDGVNLTAVQANEIIDKINEAAGLVAATNATGWREIPTNVVDQVTKLAQEAAAIAGLSLTYDAAAKTVAVKDTTGTTVVTSGQVVKQTGHSFNIVWMGSFVAVSLLAITAFVLKKTKVSHVEDQRYAL